MKQQFTAKHPWTILAAGAAIQVLTGIPAAWGVFQQPVMDEYGLSEQGAGYAFGILIAAFGVGCVLGGFLQDSRGPRCAALWGTALLCGGFFAAAILPGGSDYTFWGKGVSQGHSDAIRRIKGVKDARQYTIPVEAALTAVRSKKAPKLTTRDKHTRECFVVAEEGADLKAIEEAIVTMPNYFADYEIGRASCRERV